MSKVPVVTVNKMRFSRVSKFLISLGLISMVFFLSPVAWAQSRVDDPTGTGSLINFPENLDKSLTAEGDFATYLGKIINFFLGFVALVAVLLIVYGGVMYMTSAGDPEKAKKGKSTIMYTVIGIVIIALAYSLVTTVIKGVGGDKVGGGPGAGGGGTGGATPVPEQVSAAFTVTPFTGNLGTIFRLDASGSRSTAGRKLNYIWDFNLAVDSDANDPSGDTTNDTQATEKVVNLDSREIYKVPGEYEIGLTVSDSVLTERAKRKIKVVSQPPAAKLQSSFLSVEEPGLVTFDATASIDPDGEEVIKYEWDFGDDQRYSESKSQASNSRSFFSWLRWGWAAELDADGFNGKTTHAYSKKGIYNVVLTVTDASGDVGQAKQQVNVKSVLGAIVQPASGSSFIGQLPATGGLEVKFEVRSKQGEVAELNFGDGSKETKAISDGKVTVAHTYKQAGKFTVKVVVSDIEGNENKVTRTVHISGRDAPIASAKVIGLPSADKKITAYRRERITFSAEDSLAANGSQNLEYSWEMGDRSGLKSGARIVHEYREVSTRPNDQPDNPSSYQVTLTVTDKNNQKTATDNLIVVVANRPPTAVLLVSNREGEEPLLVNLDGSRSSDPDGRVRYFFRILKTKLPSDLDASSGGATPAEFMAVADSDIVSQLPNSLVDQFRLNLSHDGGSAEVVNYYAYLAVEDDDGAKSLAGPEEIKVTRGKFAPRITIQAPFERVFDVGDKIDFKAKVLDHQSRPLASDKIKWEAVPALAGSQKIDLGTGVNVSWDTKTLAPGVYAINVIAKNTIDDRDYEGQANLSLRLFIPIVARLQTTPAANRSGEIVLDDANRQVSFDASGSSGGLATDTSDLKFFLDADLAYDSDGDGVRDKDSDVTFDGSGVGSYTYSSPLYKGGELLKARLLVRDSFGHEKTVEKVIRINKQAALPSTGSTLPPSSTTPATPTTTAADSAKPVARITFIVKTGSKEVVFDGSGSVGSSGLQSGITGYRWDFDLNTDSDSDGNAANDSDSVEAKPTHTYQDSKSYFIELEVTDKAGKRGALRRLVVIP